LIEIPPENIGGDFAFPCFSLAKELKKAPNIIAEEISKQLVSKYFEKITTVGPYINVYIDKKDFIKKFYDNQDPTPADYENQDTKVLIEYMSANPNKPLHI